MKATALNLPIVGVHPILGELRPDPVGNALGTGFARFNGKHFDGLCREAGGCIDILAIVSYTPGHGHLREFIYALQDMYARIRFYAVMNPRLYTYLSLMNFNDFAEWGTDGPNLVWERQKAIGT